MNDYNITQINKDNKNAPVAIKIYKNKEKVNISAKKRNWFFGEIKGGISFSKNNW